VFVEVSAQVPTVLGAPAVQSELAQQPVGALATHFVLLAVQRREPALHAVTQEVPLQATVPPVGAVQTVQAVPQWAASLAKQPVFPHRRRGDVQEKSHVPLEQIAVLLAGGTQAVQDVVPQLLALVFEEQTPLQS
jgi:hypothetical protein